MKIRESKAGFKLINLWQTQEERRSKYWLARSCGANSYHAKRMRDWRLSKIERRFNLQLNTAQAYPAE